MLILFTEMRAIPPDSSSFRLEYTVTALFTPTTPVNIGRLSNKKSDPRKKRYLWVGFSDNVRRRLYDPELDANSFEREEMRWHEGEYKHGRFNLTPEGEAICAALLELNGVFDEAIWELWLPWCWRDEFGDMIRIEFDIDYTDELIEHIESVFRRLYGDSVTFIKDLALAG